MKKLTFTALLLSICCCKTFAQVPVTTNLKLHLDAALGFNSTSTATWQDQSGFGNHMTAGSHNPVRTNNVYGTGFKGIFFNGSTDYLYRYYNKTNGFRNPGGTMFVVRIGNTLSNTIGPDYRTTLSFGAGNSYNDEFAMMGNWAIHTTGTGTWLRDDHQCYSILPDSLPVVLTGVVNSGVASGDVSLYVNGIVSTNPTVPSPTPTALTTISRSITVGARYDATGTATVQGGTSFSGYILEILAYDTILTPAQIESVNNYLKHKYSVNYAACNTIDTAGCDDLCYWRVTGNYTHNSNNVLGTLSDNDILIQTNGLNRGIITSTTTANGFLGWNTMMPTARLHVNCSGGNPDSSGRSDVRFQCLENGSGSLLVIDSNGYVFNSKMPIAGGGISNTCTSVNTVTKVTDGAGNLGCSQIYDDGTSVGIGTTGGFSYTWSGGLTGSTTPPSSGTLALDVNGVTRALAYIATSDENFKTNIQNVQDPFKIINGLNGKTYFWNDATIKREHADGGRQYGFIAQEVKTALPEAVAVDQKGNYGINYNSFIPVLVEADKQLYQMYQEEKATNDALKAQIADLQTKVNGTASTATNNVQQTDNGNALYQNTPNPFGTETAIGYYIGHMQQNAYIMVYDLNGKELNRYPVNTTGKGSIAINGGTLPSGMYIYALIVDGQTVDSKKMTLVK